MKNKKNTKIIIAVVAIILMVVIIFSVVRKKPSTDTEPYEEPEVSSGGSASSAGASATSKSRYDRVFNPNKYVGSGSRGVNVMYIQKAVNRYRRDLMGVAPIKEDGIWGSQTTSAVQQLVKTPTTYTKVKEAVQYQFKRLGRTDPYINKTDYDPLDVAASVTSGDLFGWLDKEN